MSTGGATEPRVDLQCPHCERWPTHLVPVDAPEPAYVCPRCECKFTERDMRLIEASPTCPVGQTVTKYSGREDASTDA